MAGGVTRRKLLTREMELPRKGRGCNRSICTEKKGRQLIDKRKRGEKREKEVCRMKQGYG
jgi:hypothetical protein